LLFPDDDAIVVVRSRKEDAVEAQSVPPVLRARLGPDATSGLVELLTRGHQQSRDAVIAACTERFERRLVEEISKVRVEVAHLGATLREEMAGLRADLRQEMAAMRADVRQEMAAMGAGLRQEMGTGRVELFKWCFLFWVGQVLAIGGLMGVMLRLVR
jgi:hypothetical protein